MSKCTIIIPLSLTSVFAQDMRASALDCTAVSQIFEQSLTARGKHSLSRIWLRRWKTDSWIRPLFSQTLELSLGKNSLKSWLEEFSRLGGLVSPLVAQANAKQPRMNAGSSTSLQMELPLCGPVFFSPKTSKGFYQQKCQTALPFLATASRDWKAYITELRQAYSARLNAERRTNASECSSWPTISVNESKNSVGGSQMDRKSIPLGTMAAMHGPAVPASSNTDGSRRELWATPRAGKTTDENPETWAKRQAKGDVATMPLTAQVKTWQTATVSTGAHRQKDGSMIDKLDQQVKQSWPTPSADGDSRPGANADPVKWQQIADAKKAQGINKQLFLTTKVAMESSGKLNPRWVETLMGLPVGWTMPSCASPVTIERMSSDSSVTVSSQQQPNEPSEA